MVMGDGWVVGGDGCVFCLFFLFVWLSPRFFLVGVGVVRGLQQRMEDGFGRGLETWVWEDEKFVGW